MAHILTAVTGSTVDIVPIKRALISVSDKTGIIDFCRFLVSVNVELISTGGTAQAIRDAGLPVMDVSVYTNSPECLDGRVKTLHPKIHGGILAVRGNEQHIREMIENNIQNIDMTILNLYPFEATVAKENSTFEQCIENIDIGGPSMLRSTAKNHQYTSILTSPNQYQFVQQIMEANQGGTTLALRKHLAAAAFALSASYDSMIANYFAQQLSATTTTTTSDATITALIPSLPAPVVTRVYEPAYPLKYGCNPHQIPASILRRLNQPLPFEIMNGTPGYINLLDACNAYQLVLELQQGTGLVAAASFKHVSPAGAAVAVPLTPVEYAAYEVKPDTVLTPVALAYLRARHADPMCSYGDFCAVSDIVDETTALFIKTEVSDGIIAPGYSVEAMEILKKKKNGKFIILQGTPHFQPDSMEYREVFGMTFSQKRNETIITKDMITANIVTNATNAADTTTPLPDSAVRDLIVASICIKYTQSNSVGFSTNGMMIGVGAGQQSRVDCVKLAGRKVTTWLLRQHPKVLTLPFKTSGVKRQDRINARVRYIEGDFTTIEKEKWNEYFTSVPDPLTEIEKVEFMTQPTTSSTGICLSSDAFFPFRDSIDFASKYNVQYIVQPGGSIQDQEVIQACHEYDMTMAFTNLRLFHH